MTPSSNFSLSAVLTVVVFLLVFHEVESTHLSYTFELRCVNPKAKVWCAEIYLFEEEGEREYDDPWWYGSLCTNKTTYKMYTTSLDPGGDGLMFDDHYEPRWIIYHNCTERVLPSLYEKCQLNDKECLNSNYFFFKRYLVGTKFPSMMTLPKERRGPTKCECLFSEPRRLYIERGWPNYGKQVYETPTLGIPNATLHAYRDPECHYPIKFGYYLGKPPCTWSNEEFEHSDSYNRRFIRKNRLRFWQQLKTYFWDDPIDVYSTDTPDRAEKRTREHREKMLAKKAEEDKKLREEWMKKREKRLEDERKQRELQAAP